MRCLRMHNAFILGNEIMNTKQEITKYASDADKPILLWLLAKYPLQHDWSFVASCTVETRRDIFLFKTTVRVWKPTREGRLIYSHAHTRNES